MTAHTDERRGGSDTACAASPVAPVAPVPVWWADALAAAADLRADAGPDVPAASAHGGASVWPGRSASGWSRCGSASSSCCRWPR